MADQWRRYSDHERGSQVNGLPFIPVTDPKQAAEMRLAQAQESVLAAALAYDDAENEPTNGSTARAAYWGRYTTALGDYAAVHAEVFAPNWPRVYMDLLVQAGSVSRETEWPFGPPPATAPVEPCEIERVGDLGRVMCLSHDKVIERGLKCPTGGEEA